MIDMRKNTRVHRGDLMRLIAAKYAKLDSLGRSTEPGQQRLAERQKLKGQIADLKQQMLA
jgi:hypothetical protein